MYRDCFWETITFPRTLVYVLTSDVRLLVLGFLQRLAAYLRSFRNDCDRNWSVVQYVVTHTSQYTSADNTQSTWSHNNMISVEAVHTGNNHFTWRCSVFRINTSLNLKFNIALDKEQQFDWTIELQVNLKLLSYFRRILCEHSTWYFFSFSSYFSIRLFPLSCTDFKESCTVEATIGKEVCVVYCSYD